MKLLTAGTLLLTLLLSTPAFAQDFGSDWLHKVTRKFQQADEGALDPRPFKLSADVGGMYYFDDNIFLEERNTNSDSIFVTYGRAGLDYAQENFDAEADLLVNYNSYVRYHEESDDEQRLYGRMRYTGHRVTLEVAEIFRRESESVDVQFAERQERIVSNTFPRAAFRVSDRFTLQATGNIQLVRYDSKVWDAIDNNNYRAGLQGSYLVNENVEGFAEAGYTRIDYIEPDAPPDVEGYYVHLGARGHINDRLYVHLSAGPAWMESEDYPGTNDNSEHSTADVNCYARYLASERLTFTAGYTRRFIFSPGGSPFEVHNRVGGDVSYEASEDLMLLARSHYSRVHEALGEIRHFYNVTGQAVFNVIEDVFLNGGVTWRAGELVGGSDFDNFIFFAGLSVRL